LSYFSDQEKHNETARERGALVLKINKKVEYALMALKFMADKNKSSLPLSEELSLTSAREVCDEFNIPFDTTAKVMQLMNNQDLLKSTKGIKGGYMISRNLSEVTYMDLVKVIEGKVIGRVCVSTKGTCELFNKCNIITPIELLNRKLNIFLENLTLAELLLGAEFNPATINAPIILEKDEALS
jgi:Rrf2 family protein